VENCGTVALTAGVKYSIVVEFFEDVGTAGIVLSWWSPTQYKQVIPASQLFPGNPTPTPTITSTPTQTPTSTRTPTPTMTPTPAMPSGQVWKYYYYASGQPVAVRVQGDPNPQNNGLFYTMGDQLGSTSVVTDSSGNKVSETRYTPWGETRYSSGSAPTDRKYTGQREDAGIGLYYYNARWYDAKLGRFAQADTIVNSGVQGYDRYAYVKNSPMGSSDPTGHEGCGDIAWGGARDICFARTAKIMAQSVEERCGKISMGGARDICAGLPMKTSYNGIDFILDHEKPPPGSDIYTPYNDSTGTCTVGGGHAFIPGTRCEDIPWVKSRYSQKEIDDFLQTDLAKEEQAIRDLVHVDLTQSQFDALVSFLHNLGAQWLQRSDLLAILNSGFYEVVPAIMNQYIGDILGGLPPGLPNRRRDEGVLFQYGDYDWEHNKNKYVN
jgi:RHS repeat-associated protein